MHTLHFHGGQVSPLIARWVHLLRAAGKPPSGSSWQLLHLTMFDRNLIHLTLGPVQGVTMQTYSAERLTQLQGISAKKWIGWDDRVQLWQTSWQATLFFTKVFQGGLPGALAQPHQFELFSWPGCSFLGKSKLCVVQLTRKKKLLSWEMRKRCWSETFRGNVVTKCRKADISTSPL